MAKQDTRSNGAAAALGRVPATRNEGRGPTIWLAGDPDDLKEWMPMGIAGIVLNTVVHNEYAQNHGSAITVVEKYLELTDSVPSFACSCCSEVRSTALPRQCLSFTT